MMKKITDCVLTGERAEFFAKDTEYVKCTFEDGESPLKESSDVGLNNCTFGWKYPLWYSKNATVKNTFFNEFSRSGIWYAENLKMQNCKVESPKNFRRCKGVYLADVDFKNASETLWTCENVQLENVRVHGDYFGMNSKKIVAKNIKIDGNYCFDGGSDIEISDSVLNSKDSFWNVKNAIVRNCTIIGEYIGWNSENLTFINCKIESHQGFCYIKGLKLINCTLENTDLAFEYCSDVEADILGRVDSVKNSVSGRIVADEFGEIIMENDKVDVTKTAIETRKK